MRKDVCDKLCTIVLRTIHRTKDMELLVFLRYVRVHQPTREFVAEFFSGRILSSDLRHAVSRMVAWMTAAPGRIFVWLCVTNAGADRVNSAVLESLGIDPSIGIPGDPKVLAGRIAVRVGLYVRLTRNLDKDARYNNFSGGNLDDS